MWQEARKHERKLRGMMVDYKRRGERRREYYEKIKKDPAQFLQVHGRAYKIHLDSAVALAAESPVNMMPWQGDTNNMIDRFDVRAHLDYIPTYTPPLLNTVSPEQETEERKCNYERYRGLVQNDFASISEEQCLYQIYVDELYGGLQRPNEDEKKKLAEKKATIGYTYEDSTVTEPDPQSEKGEDDDSDNSESEEDEGIPDIDVEVDVDELNQEQIMDLNKMATPYGMADGDFVRMLRKDKEEVEAIKHAKALEAEKAIRRRSSSSLSSSSSRSSSRRSSRSSSRSRRSRRRGGRDSRYSRSRSRRRSDSRSRQRGGGGRSSSSSRRRYDRSRSRSRSNDRDRGRRFILFSYFLIIINVQDMFFFLNVVCVCLLQPKMTPQERLKLRMQKALNKQSKADKKAAQVKILQQEHKRQEREGELRAMARKIRMKERERREKERDEWERQYGRQSHSPSPSPKYSMCLSIPY
uniref:Suppressor of white apricot N-terminal domain-containing protein n=1 Tax=Denticeps clupeoides TaxID=299321 RepID=A0AAY4E7D5_9TELE